MRPEELAYLAGIVDGEGCIGVWQNANGSHRGALEIGSTSAALMEWLSARLGGSVIGPRVRAGRRNWYRWRLSGRAAGALCARLLPYLVIKPEAAALLVEFGLSVDQGHRTTTAIRGRRAEMVERFHILNGQVG